MGKEERNVLIIGGGVAALSAASALVESNQKNNSVKFNVHIITQGHRWGGRASSWRGGGEPGPHLDLRLWPKECTLNHGFHAIFDESTYKNFWHTFSMPWNYDFAELRGRLCSNRHEFLLWEKNLVRLNNRGGLWSTIKTAFELWLLGGWSLLELKSYHDVVLGELNKYSTFKKLQDVDVKEFTDVDFKKWSEDRGLKNSVCDKKLFKFISEGSYVYPNKIDAATAIRGLWIFARDYDASEWFYIDGGITEEIMNPLGEYLRDMGVKSSMYSQDPSDGPERTQLERFYTVNNSKRITGCRAIVLDHHPDSSEREDAHEEHKHGSSHKQIEFKDDYYYISTIPIGCLWDVLMKSGMDGDFANIDKLYNEKLPDGRNRFPRPAATVNLQAWFKERLIPGRIDNVIAGLDPLCVMIDYKNVPLRKYEDDEKWPGSVLEINGSLGELISEAGKDIPNIESRLKQPDDPETIGLAKDIMIYIAKRYKFTALEEAVKRNDFLNREEELDREDFEEGKYKDMEWVFNKIPPFLWINNHKHNGFFVTVPGTFDLRPDTKTVYENLFLAGDWIKNGFNVPCMEGAARSGRIAARAIQDKVIKEGVPIKNLIEALNPD